MNECRYCGNDTIFHPLCHVCEAGDEVTAISSMRQMLHALFTVSGRHDAAALMPAQCEYIDRPLSWSSAALKGVLNHAMLWHGGAGFWIQAFTDSTHTTGAQDLEIAWRVYVSRPSQVIINQAKG